LASSVAGGFAPLDFRRCIRNAEPVDFAEHG